MEVEAVDEGTVAKILIEEGTEGVKVNAPIAVLAEEGEDVGEAAKAGPSEGGGASVAAEAQAEDASPKETGSADAAPTSGNGATAPPAPPKAAKSGGDIPDDVKAGPVPRKNGERVFASPLARRIAGNEGIDITAITGSGPKGRIVKRDVEAALEKGVPAAAEAPAAEAPGMFDRAFRKFSAAFEERADQLYGRPLRSASSA